MFKDEIPSIREEMDHRLKAYAKADRWIEALGLSDVWPYVTTSSVWLRRSYGKLDLDSVHPDWDQQRYGWKNTLSPGGDPYIDVNLHVRMEDKAPVREIVLQSNADMWKKSKGLNTSGSVKNYLEHRWTYEEVDESTEEGEKDMLTLNFYQEINEGDEVGGCTVKRERFVHTPLVLSCSLKKE